MEHLIARRQAEATRAIRAADAERAAVAEAKTERFEAVRVDDEPGIPAMRARPFLNERRPNVLARMQAHRE
jgi:hypothetical protein